MFDESSALSIIDDTKPLTAIISETENNGSYIVSIKLETLNGFYVLQPFLVCWFGNTQMVAHFHMQSIC